jgi:hypothetical protein
MQTTVQVSRERLDALARTFMENCREKYGFQPMSLDEFLIEYELDRPDTILGRAILGLFPEYGGEHDPC